MASEKVETVVAGNYLEMEREEEDSKSAASKLSRLFWHGGSVYDAWFSCASNQALTIILELTITQLFFFFLFFNVIKIFFWCENSLIIFLFVGF